MSSIKNTIQSLVVSSQKFADKAWFAPLIGFFALADCFILIVPTDGFIVSSVMLRPKRWVRIAIWTSIGSTLGAGLLAWFIQTHGTGFFFSIFPEVAQNSMWVWTQDFFEKHGLIVVLLVAASPIAQHPAIILAALSNAPVLEITGVVLIGRLVKYLVLAYISSYAPHLVSRIWGLKKELKEVKEAAH